MDSTFEYVKVAEGAVQDISRAGCHPGDVLYPRQQCTNVYMWEFSGSSAIFVNLKQRTEYRANEGPRLEPIHMSSPLTFARTITYIDSVAELVGAAQTHAIAFSKAAKCD